MFKVSNKLPIKTLNSLCNDGYLPLRVITPVLLNYFQSRNTFILKRRHPTKLYKKGIDQVKLKGKDYVYDLVEDTDINKKPDVQVILTKYVEGIGQPGDLVTVKRNVAYNKLLVTGLAEYSTPEVLEKIKLQKESGNKEKETYSSVTAAQTMHYLENQLLAVVMNKETKWTIQPWHIRVSFRKAGIFVPDDCISLPAKPIIGPDTALEGKEFCITVTINNKEKAVVRCKIHHWSTSPGSRLPFVQDYWLQKPEPVFPEEAEKLEELYQRFTTKHKLKANLNT